MLAAVLDSVQTEAAPLTLPSIADILYPDFFAPVPTEPGSAPSESAFKVDSLQKADWTISRILDAEARIARRAELASELHARVDSWLEKASASDHDSVVYLSSLLRPYVESEISMQHRSRSLVLPSGTAQLRKLPDTLTIEDAQAALAFCEISHPEAVVIKKELIRSTLKSLIASQAEAIPGCAFELGQDQLYIKPNA